jgi:LPS export ABC transporter protein LptC
MLFRILTILAVAALAISSWILSTPGRTPSLSSGAGHAARPGYYLKNAVLTDHDAQGEPSIRIAAQRIDQIAHTTAVALYDVRVDYQAPGGQAWILFGDVAHVEPGGKAVDLTGNVRLQGPDEGHGPAALIRTDALTYDVPDSVASTQDDVRIDFEEHVVTARGLIANLKERTVRLESRVNGRFHP